MKDHDWEYTDVPSVVNGILKGWFHQMNVHKSMGPDRIHPNTEGVGQFYSWTRLNLSWKSAELPDDWKLANVTPIYQKGMTEDPENL